MKDIRNVFEKIRRGELDVNAEDGFPLQLAASLGDLEGVKELIALGADPNARGGMAVRWAAEGGFHNVVEYLIECTTLSQK